MLFLNQRRQGIASILPTGAVGAEIGVFCGDFSKPFAKCTMPARLYLIDPWWVLHGERFSYRPGLLTKTAYDSAVSRMKWWIDRGLAVLVVERSQTALAKMDDAHLDWAYLDSSHDYRETKEELGLLRAKVKADGIICGHDFNTRRHPGVFRAIAEFLKETPEYELFYLDNFTQWAIRRRKAG